MRKLPRAGRNTRRQESRRRALIRGKLLERRRKLLDSVANEMESTMESSGHALSDIMDIASATIDRETSLSIGSIESSEVQEIDRAIERLDSGNYGICENCGATIATSRLSVVPSASLCIKCKAEDERMQPHNDNVALNWHRYGALGGNDGVNPEEAFGTIRGKRHL